MKSANLSEFCTYGIGGPADELVIVTTIEELQKAMQTSRFIVIGKGSNCLFDDRGFKGRVIVNRIQGVVWNEDSVRVGSGYSFSLLGIQASRKGLSGLEFASGIPGSVGGAVVMNAGAGGNEVKDVLLETTYAHADGHLETFTSIPFGYRSSPFQKMRGAVVSATFRLTKDPQAKERQEALLLYRMQTQPYKERSCGSVFRNPKGDAAGRIIESMGLKGLVEGGAKISEIHANFIVNHDGAKGRDVLHLIRRVQEATPLEPEVAIIPYEEL